MNIRSFFIFGCMVYINRMGISDGTLYGKLKNHYGYLKRHLNSQSIFK